MSSRHDFRDRTPRVAADNALNSQTEQPPKGPEGLPRQVRTTPRNSIANEAFAAAAKETPYETLRQLASIVPKPSTPVRRASSVGLPSTHRSNRQTPRALDRTPAGIGYPGSNRKPNGLTPHARAAYRENELRRAAALTPGKDRRRSGRQLRETPRDVLRALSRVLAVNSRPTKVTPQTGAQPGRLHHFRTDDGIDDGPEPVRPRLSIPLGEDDEDDSFLLPPQRLEGFDEDNFTSRSVELPRRALSEQPRGRLSRGSFGSIRTSEQFGDLTQLGLGALEGEEFDSSFAGQGAFDDEDEPILDGDPTLPRDAIEDLRHSFFGGTRRMSFEAHRTSDVIPHRALADDTETSFAFLVPQNDSATGRSPQREHAESDEDDDEQDLKVNTTHDIEDLEKDFEQSDIDGDINMHTSMQPATYKSARTKTKKRRAVKTSRYGIQYPSLPAGVVKKLATTFLRTSGNSKARLNKDTLESIMRATDWFFEQISDDLSAYAEHARRNTIDQSDVLTLMQRQRQTSTTTTPFALAQKYLPRELLQDLHMAPPTKAHRGRQLERLEENEDEE